MMLQKGWIYVIGSDPGTLLSMSDFKNRLELWFVASIDCELY
jgi:hypothetical protein